jgi:hypothetical protein
VPVFGEVHREVELQAGSVGNSGSALQTLTVAKDAGGAEEAD